MINLDNSGFATTPMLSGTEVSQLQSLYDSLNFDPDLDFAASSNDLAGPTAVVIADRIVEILTPSLTRLFPDKRPFLASFLSKGRDHGSSVEFHQDLTYTDETHYRTTLVWIPLCSVDARNGAIAVVPGSHRWTSGCRPGGQTLLPTAPHQEALGRISRLVPLSAGDALVYDAALIHGSATNTSSEVRVAVGVALADLGARLIHVHVNGDGTPTAWSAGLNFYMQQSLMDPPTGLAPAELWADPVSEADVARGIASAGVPALPAASKQVLVDPRADEELGTRGYTVVDLGHLHDTAEELRTFYAARHGDAGSGFEPDLVNPDLEYRRNVSDHLSFSLDAAVSSLFLGYAPFLRVYLAKWPGPASDLYLHRDWMYVDEHRSGHTFVVWIPLCDVDEGNGALQVLRGSHLLEHSLRGTELNAPWINHHDIVVPRLETVTARVGQAVVMNNALVHSSLPNTTDELRLVAAVGMRPAGSQLVHFLRAGEHSAWRYDVDESFFLTATPQDLMGAPPSLPVMEVLPDDQHFWSEGELLAALDTAGTTSGAPQDGADRASTGLRARTAARWRRRHRAVG